MPKKPTYRKLELHQQHLTPPGPDEEQFRRAIEDAPIPIIVHAEDG